MGYNTTIVVMNNNLGSIEEDKNFGKTLANAIREHQRTGEKIDVCAHGNRCIAITAAKVIDTHHSSHYELIKVGENTGFVEAEQCKS